MAASRTILVAGAGIGGLTLALALADRGFRAVVLEQSPQLEATGAGLQISPNCARVLIGLGAAERLKSVAVAPDSVRVRNAGGRDLVRIPIGRSPSAYGAPYWVVHRGDLQAVLLALAKERPDISLVLGARVDEYAVHPNGVTVACAGPGGSADFSGLALVGADGLWSRVRARMIGDAPPRPAGRTAWRTLLPAHLVDPEFRAATVNLWLGRGAHLVHYPVRAGALINVVAIAADADTVTGWSAPGNAEEVLRHYPEPDWAAPARALLKRPERWLRWTLYDRPPLRHWSRGPVTLLGDAVHPMLPFMAQGAAMAIEDAAVLADALARQPTDPAQAFRDYEHQRRERTTDVQRAARRNDRVYHLGGPAALGRDLVLRLALGGDLVLAQHDWIYDWRPPGPAPVSADPAMPAGSA
ncbi:MAG: FAD-dependent monooxygenase [Rhodoplanes sp.]|uniref:FAD-dependent monooxygenase n=1 Tax=Rhodoplanes sp. TaxID=1968906 RepID=UPI0017B74812|nr:FAD-dependent monooxygenase [Rhodoplanes sp.]NVO16507.1 FAD-dependent monooxygenase [Rhodoplanes sp.]